MNGCQGNTSHCTGHDIRACKLYLRRDPRPVCVDCRTVMTSMGASLTVVEPDTRPTWRRRDLSRDETGAVA